MYCYSIACGEYSDYSDKTLTHECKYSDKEFLKIFNMAFKEHRKLEPEDRFVYVMSIAKILQEKFGFNALEYQSAIFHQDGYISKPLKKHVTTDGRY